MLTSDQRMLKKLRQLYPETACASVGQALRGLMETYRKRLPHPPESALTERDGMLITDGDQIQAPGQAPLPTLAQFCDQHLAGILSRLPVLPFYPWSSDDGFSVKDYRAVDPALGDWRDIEYLERSFRLMVDGVINHASAQGEWFQKFPQDDPRYRDYFIYVTGA